MCPLHRCESGPASVGGGSPHGSPGCSGEAERPLLAHQTGRPVQDSEQPAPGRVERRGGDGGGDGGGGGGDGGGAQHAEPAAALWSSAGPGGEAATPGISGISGGERRQPAEEKVSLHPAEADGAQRQVPAALHPKMKCSLLTAQLHPVGGAGLMPLSWKLEAFIPSFIL